MDMSATNGFIANVRRVTEKLIDWLSVFLLTGIFILGL